MFVTPITALACPALYNFWKTKRSNTVKKSELEQFFCLPSCDEHDEFEVLTAQAMQYASEGDALMCMETLNKASEIAYKAIERSQVYIRTNDEPLPFVVDVSDLDNRIGGLYD